MLSFNVQYSLAPLKPPSELSPFLRLFSSQKQYFLKLRIWEIKYCSFSVNIDFPGPCSCMWLVTGCELEDQLRDALLRAGRETLPKITLLASHKRVEILLRDFPRQLAIVRPWALCCYSTPNQPKINSTSAPSSSYSSSASFDEKDFPCLLDRITSLSRTLLYLRG